MRYISLRFACLLTYLRVPAAPPNGGSLNDEPGANEPNILNNEPGNGETFATVENDYSCQQG